MNETTRTLTFVGVAAVALVVALFAAPSTELTPKELAGANLGKEFYPDFISPNEPTSLTVVSFHEKDATPKIFAVELKNGLWSIPSHHNYPADGEDRLAKTAASVIGIKREELRSSSAEDYQDLGVVDPLDKDTTRLTGRGQRITLKKGDTVLADLIIGKPLKDRPGQYFVRKPDEKATYVAKLAIDLSTKFGDWVETDLLKLGKDDLVEVVMNNYSIDEAQKRIVPGDVNELSHDKPADPWKLKGLDEAAEELDTAKINTLVDTLDNLKLVGVRPKPRGLAEDLKLNKGIRLDATTLLDLRSKGFMITPQNELVSNEGEFIAATNKGVLYILRFGEVFTGDEMEVEAGVEADKKQTDDKQKAGEKKEGEKELLPETSKTSRYLFVTTHFDEKHLGPKPEKPEKPVPEEDKPAAETKPDNAKPQAGKEADKKEAAPTEKKETAPPDKKDEKKPGKKGDCDTQEKPAAEKTEKDEEAPARSASGPLARAQEKPATEKTEKDEEAPPVKKAAKPQAAPAADKKDPLDEEKKPAAEEKKAEPAPKKSPAELEKEHNAALQKYESDLKAYEDKVKAGKEQVAKLNRRFGDWYYVISADNFAKLHLSRKDLVKAKEKPAEDKDKPATPDDPAVKKPDETKPEEKKGDDAKEEPKKENKKAEKKEEAKPEE